MPACSQDDPTPDYQSNDDEPTSSESSVPSEVTGYTAEAEEDLNDKQVSEEEVEEVVPNPEEIESDDYWELEKGDIQVDIADDGIVLEVDRDD